MAQNSRDPVPPKWDASQIPSQSGKRAIVTGSNSGIGFVTALELARHGADVVLACRNESRGREAVDKIKEELTLSPEAGTVEFRTLDVSSLSSVQSFADDYRKTHDRLDVLVNNAGIMAVPFARSVDGIESHFATNHLGHFALTARLFDLLKKSSHARIVNVSSGLYRKAQMDLDAIVTPEDSYAPFQVYSNTKLYNLLFTAELNRRLQAQKISNVVAVGVHPGFVATNLKNPFFERSNWFQRQVLKLIWMLPICQSPDFGALPSLYAATAPGVQPNDYYVPDGLRAWTGYPRLEETMDVVMSETHAMALWDESEKLAKVRFPLDRAWIGDN